MIANKDLIQDSRRKPFCIQLLFLAVLAVSAILCSPCLASEASPAEKNPVEITGMFRFRNEFNTNMQYDSTKKAGNDNPALSKLQFQLAPSVKTDNSWLLQLETANCWNSYSASRRDDFHVVRAQVLHKLKNVDNLYVTIGRQFLVFSDYTLLGPGPWNLHRTWDGVNLCHKTEKMQLNLFNAFLTRRESDELLSGHTSDKLAGFYGIFDNVLNGFQTELYYLQKEVKPKNTDVRTAGIKIRRNTKNDFSWHLEVPLQTGTVDGKRHSAQALRFVLQKKFKAVRYQPNLELEYRWASGDKIGTSGNEGFDVLYPTGHAHLGSMDLVSWTNIRSIGILSRFFPSKNWDIDIKFYNFWLNEASAGMKQRKPAANQAAVCNDFGKELDLTWRLKSIPDLDLVVGTSIFFPGEFIKSTGSSDTPKWAFVQVLHNF